MFLYQVLLVVTFRKIQLHLLVKLKLWLPRVAGNLVCHHSVCVTAMACSRRAVVAWAELPLPVMRTYLWVILGSWMLQGLCSFFLALRQGSPVHSDDRGACSKLPDLYCCTYRSLHLLWELLNWTQLALSFCIARHPTSSFLFFSSPPLPFLLSSIFLPSPSCVQWGENLFRGGEMDFCL